MKLILNDVELDYRREHEIQNSTMHVILVTTDGHRFESREITEVHWLYPSTLGRRFAIESMHRYESYTEDIALVVRLEIVSLCPTIYMGDHFQWDLPLKEPAPITGIRRTPKVRLPTQLSRIRFAPRFLRRRRKP